MAPLASGCPLNSGELIQVEPGETRQRMHRDTGQYPAIIQTEAPAMTNAILALDRFTEDNGATHVVPGSAAWERSRESTEAEEVRAIMEPGSALVIRGDVLHGAGANNTGHRRCAISIGYCLGWLRPIENSLLNVSFEQAVSLNPRLQRVLGFSVYDGKPMGTGGLGYVGDYQDPAEALAGKRTQ